MELGIHLPHIGRKASPENIRRAAMQAEQLGLADVWVSEHIIVPKDGGYPPSPNFWDPVLTLTWAAACTERVRLGTSVLVLPMRHPLPLAKELATLQNLSKGRLILGAGRRLARSGIRRTGRAVQGTRPPHGRRHRHDEGGVEPGPGHVPDEIYSRGDQQHAVTAATGEANSDLDRRIVRCRDQSRAAAGWLAWQPGPARGRGGGREAVPRGAAGRTISRFRCGSASTRTMSMSTRAALAAYKAAGIQHVMAAPEDREIDPYLKTVERFVKAGEGCRLRKGIAQRGSGSIDHRGRGTLREIRLEWRQSLRRCNSASSPQQVHDKFRRCGRRVPDPASSPSRGSR